MLLLGAAKLYGRPQEVGRKHAHDPNPNRLLPPSTGWNSSPHLKPPDTESVRCGHSVAQSGAVLWVSRVSTQRVVSIFPWGSTGAEFQPRLALFTPKQEGCPEETGNTKKSSFPHTPDAAARTPVRLKVCAGARGGGHYPPENSRTGVDCSLSRVAPPPTTVQSLTPTTRASHQ